MQWETKNGLAEPKRGKNNGMVNKLARKTNRVYELELFCKFFARSFFSRSHFRACSSTLFNFCYFFLPFCCKEQRREEETKEKVQIRVSQSTGLWNISNH